MMYISLRQSSHLLVPHLYGVAYTAMLHLRLRSIPLCFNSQICFESSVLFSNSWFRNEFSDYCNDTWTLHQMRHNIRILRMLHYLCKKCTFLSNCQQVDSFLQLYERSSLSGGEDKILRLCYFIKLDILLIQL